MANQGETYSLPPNGLSARRLAVYVVVVIAVLLGLTILYFIHELLVLMAFAGVLAAALSPALHWLHDRKFPTRLGILVFYLLFLLIAGGVGALIGDLFIDQAQSLAQNFPAYVDRISDWLAMLPFMSDVPELDALFARNVQDIGQQALRFILSGFGYLKTFLGGVTNVLTILVFAFFLLADTPYFRQMYLSLFPIRHQDRALSIAQQLVVKVGGYVRGQLLVMLFVGVLFWLGLTAIGVPYAMLLGIIGFLLEIIPVVGPALTAGIAVLIALAEDPILALWTIGLFFAIQMLENYLLVPKIMGQSTGLHSFWVFFSLLAGSLLMGIQGVLLAIPVALLINVLLHEWRQTHPTAPPLKVI
jgi:predicted PurR-regulated permease PerM